MEPAFGQTDIIKFVPIGPLDAPIPDIIVSTRQIHSSSVSERFVLLNKDAFGRLESFVNGKDSTYYLLNGQSFSIQYFKKN